MRHSHKNAIFQYIPMQNYKHYIFTLFLVLGVTLSSINAQKKESYTMMSLEHDYTVLRTQFINVTNDLQHFDFNNGAPLTREERLALWGKWVTFLDYIVALDKTQADYKAAYSKATVKQNKDALFSVQYALFLMQYRFAMDTIFELEKHTATHIMLNEPVPELGLESGMYSKLKFRFLNIEIATKFMNYVVTSKTKPVKTALLDYINEDENYIWKAGTYKGPLETIKNGGVITKDTWKSLMFPVKKKALLFSRLRVRRGDSYLVSQDDQQEMQKRLLPGDILLERREWHLSNLGIPGFWPHAALYIGTPKERNRLENSLEVQEWVRGMGETSGKLEALLKRDFPEKYSKSLENIENEMPRIIESHAPGVTFTTLSYSTNADSVAAIRPNVSDTERAKAIYRAFTFLGRPYDYNFDFNTDSALVCTELIVKAYEKDATTTGVEFPRKNIAGNSVVPANEIVRVFDAEYGSENQRFSFVFFYDGSESKKKSISKTVDAFIESWKRPKWHIVVSK